MDASKQCQRAVVPFLTAENVSASEIYHWMQNVYVTRIGIPILSKFLSRRSNTDDRPQPGQVLVVFFHYKNPYTIILIWGHSVSYAFCTRRWISLALSFSAIKNCTTACWHRFEDIHVANDDFKRTPTLSYTHLAISEDIACIPNAMRPL